MDFYILNILLQRQLQNSLSIKIFNVYARHLLQQYFDNLDIRIDNRIVKRCVILEINAVNISFVILNKHTSEHCVASVCCKMQRHLSHFIVSRCIYVYHTRLHDENQRFVLVKFDCCVQSTEALLVAEVNIRHSLSFPQLI
jgi:hypothetical protein